MENTKNGLVQRNVRLGEERQLFPPVDAYNSGMLDVGSSHQIYWEQSGSTNGVPVVFLHGGPGAGIAPTYRRFFDPSAYRIVLFDQRGAGRSTPEASIVENSTDHLVGDIETLRCHLGIERWSVFGGSWGSTLALAYGQAHPDRCISFILRGIFLFTDDEIAWFIGGEGRGMDRFFPEAYRLFSQFIPAAERGDMLGAYYSRLTHPDPAIHRPAAAAWCAYENACARLVPLNPKSDGNKGVGNYYNGALSMARIEAHYMMNRGFLAPGQLLKGIKLIENHPAVIVQGRYDMVCPIASADRLARVWQGAHYCVVPDAGHASMEPGIRSALVRATEDFKHYR